MSVFDPNTDETPNDFLEALVGEGKKFADPQALAKGKWEADRHAARLEQENASLRAEREAAVKLEDLIRQAQANPNPNPEPKPEAHQPAKPALDAEELQEMIRNALNQDREQSSVAKNVNEVTNKLIELYGDEDKANAVVKQKASELEVPVEWLEQMAAQSPKAFFAQLGITSTTPAAPRPTHGDVNVQAFGQNSGAIKPGTYAFYENLRKTDPKLYASPKIQMQIHKEALANPEAFFPK